MRIAQYNKIKGIFTNFTPRAQIFGFIFFPILMLPSMIKGSIRGIRISQFLLSVFLGLLSVLTWPPIADAYRHAIDFYEIQNLSFHKVITDYYRGSDFILLFGGYLFGQLHLSFEFLRLILMAVAYGIALHLYNIILKNKIFHGIDKSYIFWMCIFMVPFCDICYAIRYGMAIMIISAYIVLHYIVGRKKLVDYVYLIIGLCMHFGTIWLIALCLIGNLVPNKFPRWCILLLGVFFLGLSMYANEIISGLAGMFYNQRLVNAYVFKLADKYIQHNLIGTILELIKNISVYLSVIIALFYLPYKKETKIFILIVFIWILTWQLFEVNRRIGVALAVLLPIMICVLNRGKRVLMKIMVSSYMLVIIGNWRQFTVSNTIFIFAPVPISIFQHYDYTWLLDNLNGEGTLKVYER